MIQGLINYKIEIYTDRHSITGELTLNDRRLSDHINDKVELLLNLRNVTVARLENPTHPLHTMATAVVPKSAIVLAFEPFQKAIPPSNRFYGYVKKEQHEVFLIMDGIEVRGILHTQGSPDYRRVLVNAPDAFLPITQAVFHTAAHPDLAIRQDAVLVNSQRIRFIGNLDIKSPTMPLPPQP